MKETMYDAIIIGTGFAGLCAAIRLKQKGMNFLILEKEAKIGGVWRDNTYPGAQCDVQSHLYSFSFEPYPYWSRTYGMQNEILQYMEHCKQKYQLQPHIRFQNEVRQASWQEKQNHWLVKTQKNQSYRAKFIFCAFGGLSRISYPNITGLDSFQGKLFHSARWDHSVDLTDKKVAVIGSAASAIQIVPAIVSKVKELAIFQRTASWILPKPDREYLPIEKFAFQSLPPLQWLSREWIYWQLEWRAMAFVYTPHWMDTLQKRVEAYIRKSIDDPVLRRKVTPNYKIGCKRILLSNDYYPAIQQKHVDVITTGIDSIDENGIIVKDGQKKEVDVIITATGFKVTEDYLPFSITGRNNIGIETEWQKGPEAYLGTTVKNFPNAFLIVGPNTGLAHSSMIYMMEAQVEYAIKIIAHMEAKDNHYFEVKKEVQDSYNRSLQKKLARSIWNTGGCSSWYRNQQGKNISLWPGFTFEYRLQTEFFQPADYIFH